MAIILGSDFSLAAKDNRNHRLDHRLPYQKAFFDYLKQRLKERWKDFFAAQFGVVLYELTSSSFENDPPFPDGDKSLYGENWDHRSDCI